VDRTTKKLELGSWLGIERVLLHSALVCAVTQSAPFPVGTGGFILELKGQRAKMTARIYLQSKLTVWSL
jgi:hypothetical protein